MGFAAGGVVWWRERMLGLQRRTLRGIMSISEDVLDATSPDDIVERLARQARQVVGASDVELFLFSPTDEALQRISGHSRDTNSTVPVDTRIGTLAGAAALCFRNRSLLRIPDTRNSAILQRDEKWLPAAAVFVPMFAAGELAGVLAVYLHRRTARSNPGQDVALQHLGNQIAASIKLQDRQQMRDQLLRMEKMAAAGQLISGIAHDLRAPLENIGRIARSLTDTNGLDRELTEIARDAERGLEMIDHLLSFARMEHREARPLDVNALVSSLLELRSSERSIKQVRCENSLPVEPAVVLADRGQLEQAVLTVLVHAEHAAAESLDRKLHVSSRVVGRKILIAVDCSRPASGNSSHVVNLGDYFGFPVAQVIVQSHGGDLRHMRNAKSGVRFELELPLHQASITTHHRMDKPLRILTCLLVEPDVLAQRKLLAMLAARGHRAVPAGNAEQAADMVQRMQFDVFFCAANLAGLNWIELFQRVRRRVWVFGLMLDAYDPEAGRIFTAGEGQLLTKPIEERDLDDFLAGVEVRLAAGRS
jgi:signal transduction histidine kinase